MGMYKDLDIMIQEVSITTKAYDLNKEMISDYLNGDNKLLPQNLQNVVHAWEQELYENDGAGTIKIERMSLLY